MSYMDEYRRWREYTGIDVDLEQELEAIENQPEEIKARFLAPLNFGTGGIRGRMGAGPGRINIYTIRKVSLGLARYLKTTHPLSSSLSVCIAYDTRRNSRRFAMEAAGVLACEGMRTWLCRQPAPTPMLSYAVREIGSEAGIVITASHNPPSDNGFKVYGPDGGQITDQTAMAVTAQIAVIHDEFGIPVMEPAEAEFKGLVRWIEPVVEEEYLNKVCSVSLRDEGEKGKALPLRIVYTPLHGTGARYGPEILKRIGVQQRFTVPDQMIMDPDCPTVKNPNPENWDVFHLAVQIGQREKADLLLATDLDGDRLGVAVRNREGGYVHLTGNQLGCLLLDYILHQRKEKGTLPKNGIAVQTVVSSGLGKAIASEYDIEMVETLTGFKYIGEVIKERADTHQNRFLFGYEESGGYLAGDFVRDKDAFQAILLTVEAAAYQHLQGHTLLDALENIYIHHGYYIERQIRIDLPSERKEEAKYMMARLRKKETKTLCGSPVKAVYDYLYHEKKNFPDGTVERVMLPASDVLKYVAQDGTWLCVRPSGTEPKIKLYLAVVGNNRAEAQRKIEILGKDVQTLMGTHG